MSSNPVSQGITGLSKNPTITYITELPPTKRRELCEHCDQIDVWMQMANKMGFTDNDIEAIKRRIRVPGTSPTGELLKIWGGQYNHKIVELFGVFHQLKIFHGMRIIKDFVPPEYKLMIPISIPRISKMLQTNLTINDSSVKVQNGPVPTSSGVETTNIRTTLTTDNNITTITSNTTYGRSRSPIQSPRQSTNTSSMPNIKEIASIMPDIDYKELTEATKNWDQSLILGKGGFGTVYRGYWKHTDVAIKQIDYRGAGGREGAKVQLQQSLNELKHLHKYRHDNILPLYGYCIQGDKPCLVYQLMKGGSLEQRLNTNKHQPLTWRQRIDICLGTARGIYYLHSLRSDKPLIHGDIKPGNVLLDQCLQPKIGDFGLAMEGPNAINRAVQVSQVFGTRAYLPPEFLNSKRLSTQVDTYSFGVVLLETFTGLRAVDKNRNYLTKTIIHILNALNNNVAELIDKRMQVTQSSEELVCINSIKLGLECIRESPEARPDMETVLEIINGYYNCMS
ncbi:serine/threonine-protein kinase pelle [Cochliomyia hominivorax]